ncbi:phytoene synthase [Actibacterium mucosum KCTC 23349]|uniref:Phytoene synthase n=1 Tax=Actibacterium mucosum KCTC 23349 TaxID=1454373 RepID=A0A037ZKM8_9RHOB|nr:squalene/phytoene synthase family protein [Actibacterium mucosum]KAJ56658.1 phytoene synthase [Actibacterium mucosum KCTC 23349]
MTIQACAELVAKGDPDRFAAAMAAPVAARRVLFPLYAFNVEVSRAPWVTAEPMIAEMRLQWWRDALEEISAGGPVRRHEVVTPLAEVLDAQGAVLLDEAVDARRWDIHRDPFDDDADFADHLDKTAGHLMWTAARLLGAENNEDRVRDLAWATGLANWLRAVPQLEATGRIPLVDGRAAAVVALARTGIDRLNTARGNLPNAPAAFLPAFQTRPVLSRVVHKPVSVGDGALETSEFRRKVRLIRASLTGRY